MTKEDKFIWTFLLLTIGWLGGRVTEAIALGNL